MDIRKTLSHNLQLRSAYQDNEPISNFKPDFAGTLDYIFVETDKFTMKKILSPLDMEHLKRKEALPNDLYSSDHVALACEVEIKR